MKQEDYHNDELHRFARGLADRGIPFSDIEVQLKEKTENDILIAVIITTVKKEYYEVQRKKGMLKLAIGAAFLVVGFIITCANFYSNTSFSVVMYSFTSLGLLIMFWGFFEIFG